MFLISTGRDIDVSFHVDKVLEQSFAGTNITRSKHGSLVMCDPLRAPPQVVAEVKEFAAYLGMDAEEDKDLLWIAVDAMTAKLPDHWEELTSETGQVTTAWRFAAKEASSPPLSQQDRRCIG